MGAFLIVEDSYRSVRHLDVEQQQIEPPGAQRFQGPGAIFRDGDLITGAAAAGAKGLARLPSSSSTTKERTALPGRRGGWPGHSGGPRMTGRCLHRAPGRGGRGLAPGTGLSWVPPGSPFSRSPAEFFRRQPKGQQFSIGPGRPRDFNPDVRVTKGPARRPLFSAGGFPSRAGNSPRVRRVHPGVPRGTCRISSMD